jgi:hypothetical protein
VTRIAAVAVAALVMVGATGCHYTAATVGRVTFHREGGIEGVDQTLVVDEHGQLSGGSTDAALAPKDLDRLRELVRSSAFRDLEKSYVPDDSCCDLFTYTVAAEVGDRTYTSATADGVKDTPDVLNELIQLLGSHLH